MSGWSELFEDRSVEEIVVLSGDVVIARAGRRLVRSSTGMMEPQLRDLVERLASGLGLPG